MQEAARTQALPAVLERHFEELVALRTQRYEAERSPDFHAPDLGELDERIAAQRDGLLVDATSSWPILKSALQSQDPTASGAAMEVLLHMQSAAASDLVVDALLAAESPDLLEALGQALMRSPVGAIPVELVMESAHDELAAVILLALARHQRLDSKDPRLVALFSSESAEVRARAWQIVAVLGS